MYANEGESAVFDFEEMGGSAVLGASIYDVRTEGGSRNTPNLRTNSIDDFADKEGGGVKKSQNLVDADVIYGSPLPK